MKHLLSFILLTFMALATFAQKGTVSGSIVDSEGEPMPGATVVIMRLDSTQVTGQQTRDDGTFSITLVQTIKFPVDDSSWTEFIPGEEYGYLCYTSERVIYKVPMPKLKDGDVIISRDDAVDT